MVMAELVRLSLPIQQLYLQRLWCLIEIFVFLEMGGQRANLEVHLLEDAEVINFNAKDARCFTEEDTVRLQKVMAADDAKIDELVRDIFVHKVE